MWSFDRTVTIDKPLVTVPWRSLGFYALTGQSVITYKKRLVKETIVEALEEIRESADSRIEGSISKRKSGCVRWLLVQAAIDPLVTLGLI